jgi:hypothetical protein
MNEIKGVVFTVGFLCLDGYLSFNRSAILVAINGDFKFRPLQGKRKFRPFLQRVVTALGDTWAHLSLDRHDLKTRVSELWAAMYDEHLAQNEGRSG